MKTTFLKFKKFQTLKILILMIFMVFIGCAKHIDQEANLPQDTTQKTTQLKEDALAKVLEIISAPIRSTFPTDVQFKRGEIEIKSDDGKYTLLQHSFTIHKDSNADFDLNANAIHFKGSADFEGFKNLGIFHFDLQGSVAKGHGVLFPIYPNSGHEPKIMAIAVCTALHFSDADDSDISPTPTCESFFIDLYIRFDETHELIYNEQIEECGVADSCLSILGAVRPVQPVIPVKPQTPTQVRPQIPAQKNPPPAPAQKPVVPKAPPVAAPVVKPPVVKIQPVKPPPPVQKKPEVIEPSPPIDSSDVLVESEGEERSQQHGIYVGANRADKIPILSRILDSLGESARKVDPFDRIGIQAPVPTIKAPPMQIPSVKPPKKNVPPPVPAGPVRTEIPSKEDPRLKDKEFPFNVAFPLKGPAQVFGGHREGRLINATELLEPAANENKTFIIDADTKSLHNPNLRKTFGTFYAVEFIKKFAEFIYPVFKTTIRVNDISRRNGGAIMYYNKHRGKWEEQHGWHRVGLDADIEYHDARGRAFTVEQKWFMFKSIGVSPLVNEIMIVEKDRRAVCEFIKKSNNLDEKTKLVMRKLYVEPHHETHFHINFNCTYNEACAQGETDTLLTQYEKNCAACMAYVKPGTSCQ